jgi:acyl transferase domain-containing protein
MTESNEPTGLEIAVVGMAGRFPGAPDVETLWANLRAGVESIRRFTDEELIAAGVPESLRADPAYVPRGARWRTWTASTPPSSGSPRARRR